MSATAALVHQWASERHIRRRRDDRSYGGPDPHWAARWGSYCAERGIDDREAVFEVLDHAKAAADAREHWRYWKYLDEQVQHAAERYVPRNGVELRPPAPSRPVEDPSSEWTGVKRLLATRVNPVAYANWIEPTCQVGRIDTTIRVWLPDELTRDWLENEYAAEIEEAVAGVGGISIEYTYKSCGHEQHEDAVKS